MKEGQKHIYYITGESLKAVKTSPFLERLKKKDIEVIFMTEPIDEYMIQAIREYDGKDLVSCTKEGLEFDITEEEKKAQEDLQKEWEPICNKIKNTLGDKVMNVKLSERLSDNPCVLVTDKYGWSANMERIMKSQALRNNEMMGMMGGSKKILEINPEHPIIQDIKTRVLNTTSEKTIKNIIDMLYTTALIDSGFSLDEPSNYARQIYKILSVGLNGDDGVDVVDGVDGVEVEEATVGVPVEEQSNMEDVD